jgi:hypothetical protein
LSCSSSLPCGRPAVLPPSSIVGIPANPSPRLLALRCA